MLSSCESVQWGYELSRRSGVGAGSMYPFLNELLEAGHLRDGWEERPPAGRPPRRYYRLSDSGKKFLRDFIASAPAVNAKASGDRGRIGRPVVEP